MIFFLIFLVIAFLYAIWIFPAFQFLKQYSQKSSDQPSAQKRELQIAGVTVHVYPSFKRSSTTLIIVTGLHPNGIFDPRFIKFAELCAKQGFQVVGIDVVDFRNFLLSKTTFQTILSVVKELPAHLAAETRKRIGVLGISYGLGPAFQIASTQKIDFIVSIGGYFSLQHAIEFSFSGIHGSSQRNAHEWGRLIFASTHIEELANSTDREILKKSMELRLQLKESDAEILESQLTANGKTLLDGILKGLTAEQVELFRAIAKKRESEMKELSPEYFLEQIRPATSLYLLHGVSDDSIPYEESIELDLVAKEKGFRSRCLITEGVTHVDVTTPSGVLELLKLLHWTRSLLTEAR